MVVLILRDVLMFSRQRPVTRSDSETNKSKNKRLSKSNTKTRPEVETNYCRRGCRDITFASPQ